MLSSVCDSLGFAAPFLIPGKLLIQQLCRRNLGWDEAIPEDLQIQWRKWENKLQQLDQISLEQCFKPVNFGTVVEAHCMTFQMHQNMVMGKFHTYNLLTTRAEFIVV